MKNTKRIGSLLLAVLLMLGMTIPVYAADMQKEPSEKEENVYITLSADGIVKDIYVVNRAKTIKILKRCGKIGL